MTPQELSTNSEEIARVTAEYKVRHAERKSEMADSAEKKVAAQEACTKKNAEWLKRDAELAEESKVLYIERRVRDIVPPNHRGGWEAFDISRPEHAKLCATAIEWVDRFKRGERNGLYLAGYIGCGKTHIGFSILEALIRKEFFRIAAVNSVDLFAEIRRTYDTPGEKEADIFERLLENDVLFLDDLGAESGQAKDSTDFVLERLYMLFDRAQRQQKPTLIVSSNYGINDLGARLGAVAGGRIASRLREMTDYLGDFPKIDMREVKKAGGSGRGHRSKRTKIKATANAHRETPRRT